MSEEPRFTLYKTNDGIVHLVYWTDRVNSGRFVWCRPNDDADTYQHFVRSEKRFPTCLVCVTKRVDIS
jgi:hypothetical protein